MLFLLGKNEAPSMFVRSIGMKNKINAKLFHLTASILIIRLYSRPKIARSFLRIGFTYPWSTLKQFEVQNFRFSLVDLSAYQISMLYESFIET
jgi:hypothetical protein